MSAGLASVDKMLRKVLRLDVVSHIGPRLVGKSIAESTEVTAPNLISVYVFQEFLWLLWPCKYYFRTRLRDSPKKKAQISQVTKINHHNPISLVSNLISSGSARVDVE